MIHNLLLILIIYNILLSINILISYKVYGFTITSIIAVSALSILLSFIGLAISNIIYFAFLIMINILAINLQYDNLHKKTKISKFISVFLFEPGFEFINKEIIYKNNYIHSNKLDFKTDIDDIKITNPEALEHLAIINNKLIPSYVKIIKLNKKLKKNYQFIDKNNKELIKNKILEEIKLMNIDKNTINSKHKYQFITNFLNILSNIPFNISMKIENYKNKKINKTYQEINKIKKEINNL